MLVWYRNCILKVLLPNSNLEDAYENLDKRKNLSFYATIAYFEQHAENKTTPEGFEPAIF